MSAMLLKWVQVWEKGIGWEYFLFFLREEKLKVKEVFKKVKKDIFATT